ncbi:hypothetical protein V6Z12_D05G093700 [Gossypium hirsutum]
MIEGILNIWRWLDHPCLEYSPPTQAHLEILLRHPTFSQTPKLTSFSSLSHCTTLSLYIYVYINTYMQMERQEWRFNKVRICAEAITVRKLKQSIFHGIYELIHEG